MSGRRRNVLLTLDPGLLKRVDRLRIDAKYAGFSIAGKCGRSEIVASLLILALALPGIEDGESRAVSMLPGADVPGATLGAREG